MTARTENIPPAPYVGLRPFEFDEAALFYGRGEHIAEMVRTLRKGHFLAVVGSSGSGKSSLVRAGLLPAIAAGFTHGGAEAADWRFVIMRPGLDPYGNLLRELLPQLAPGQSLDPELIEFRRQTLRGGPRGLVEAVADSLLPEPARLVVLVDQFEEIFRFLERGGPSQPADGSSLADRRNAALAFVDMLLATAAERDPRVYVVLTMRSEYLGECEAFLGLSAAIGRSQFLTPRMTREQIQDIIERPIAAVGGRIEPQVVTDLLNSLGTAQDQLPRVEHVLLRMWNQAREARKEPPGPDQPVSLTPDDYRAAGGFESALDQHAEQLYRELGPGAKADLPSEKQRVAEQLFRSLAVRSSQGTLVRRLSSLGEVASIAGAAEQIVAEVVEHFRQHGCNFLVATPAAPLDGETTLDISHEALLRQWARLRAWIEEEARSAEMYRRLADTAERHMANKASLWRDPELQLALDWRDQSRPNETWAARYHPGFAAAMGFLKESCEARDAERAEREAQRRRELEAERQKAENAARNARRMRWWTSFSIALAAVAIGIGVFAFYEKGKAEGEKRRADDTLAYMLFMSDQLKGLGKPYLLENLGRNLEFSVKDKDDTLSRAIRGRAWLLEGQASLEQGETGDPRAALRALLKFELYSDSATRELKRYPSGTEHTRWLNEVATARGAVGDALHFFVSSPERCKALLSEDQQPCSDKWKAQINNLERNPTKEKLLAPYLDPYKPLLFDGANGMDYGRLRQLRDKSYHEARDLFQQLFDEKKTTTSVINLAGMHVTLGDRAFVPQTGTEKEARQALASYARASQVVEDNLALNEPRMLRELLAISLKIATVLKAHTALAPPLEYREEYAFVADYLKSSQGPDPGYVSRLYANPVERFMNERGWDHTTIEDDKKRFFSRFPELHYELIERIAKKAEAPENGADVMTLTFKRQFYGYNEKLNISRSGAVEQVLKLRRRPDTGQWEIVQDYDKNYERE